MRPRWAALLVLALAGGVGPTAGCGVERHLEAGEEALKQHQLAEAEASFRRVLERQPESADALYGLGWVYHLAGEPARARDYFQRCTRVAPADHRGFKGLGSVAMSEQQVPQAIDWFTQALTRVPDDPAVLNSLAVAHMQAQRYDEALAVLDRAGAAASQRGELGLNRAECLFQLQRHAEALETIEQSLGTPMEEVRFRALLLVLRARVLVGMTGGRVDPDRCAETVPPLLAYLEAAGRAIDQAEQIGIEVGEIADARRRVHRRRGYITEQCPGDWAPPAN